MAATVDAGSLLKLDVGVNAVARGFIYGVGGRTLLSRFAELSPFGVSKGTASCRGMAWVGDNTEDPEDVDSRDQFLSSTRAVATSAAVSEPVSVRSTRALGGEKEDGAGSDQSCTHPPEVACCRALAPDEKSEQEREGILRLSSVLSLIRAT